MSSIGRRLANGSVLTMGIFDGLHLGHQQLIHKVLSWKERLGLPSVLLTFDPHPSVILRPEQPVQRLFPQAEYERVLREMGVDWLVFEPFTAELANQSAETFLGETVLPNLQPRVIVVGYDFAFGRGREGTADWLRERQAQGNFKVEGVEAVKIGEVVVSSTQIRQLLRAGAVHDVGRLLGREFSLYGTVAVGRQMGRRLGFPTANLCPLTELLPASGVYVTRLFLASGGPAEGHPSVTNIGQNPTFLSADGLGQPRVETHILDGHHDLYGMAVRIEFLERLRPEMTFASAAELTHQIELDIEKARVLFSSREANTDGRGGVA